MGFLDPRPISREEAIALAGPALTEDPNEPGTYVIVSNRVSADPNDPGTFLIGA
jgi:hypothetical protein